MNWLYRLAAVLASSLARVLPAADGDLIESLEPRSGHWPKVRADHLAKHPCCVVCGGTDDLNVHHVEPFHEHPERECDPENLVTLCRDHHFLFGHLQSWKSWNSHVRQDAAAWRKKIADRP